MWTFPIICNPTPFLCRSDNDLSAEKCSLQQVPCHELQKLLDLWASELDNKVRVAHLSVLS